MEASETGDRSLVMAELRGLIFTEERFLSDPDFKGEQVVVTFPFPSPASAAATVGLWGRPLPSRRSCR